MASFVRIFTVVAQQKKIKLTEEEKSIAIRATKALGLAVAGVDLIRQKKVYWCLK